MSGASGQRPGRTPAAIVPREQPTITAAESLENIRARESGKSALPRFGDAEQQRQEQRMQRIANMRTAPENRQAQLQQFARLAKTRMWSGSDGLRGLAVPPKAIAEHEDLYRLLSRLPTDFPVEGWEKLPCKRQLALMEKTDLSREEQWTFLNAPAVITTLGKIQDLQLNRTAYGLSAAQIERTSDELMLLANARLEANGVDSPFRETKAKQRFLRMLDMQEEEVMESVLSQGKQKLTGYEQMRYDERGESGGEEPEIITFRTKKPNPEIIVIPGKAPTPTPRPISVPTPAPTPIDYGESIADQARKYLGVAYGWGGKNPSGNKLDCSGLVRNSIGGVIPGFYESAKTSEGARHMAQWCTKNGYAAWQRTSADKQPPKEANQPGRLVFWCDPKSDSGYWKNIVHVGICAGNGKVIEASSQRRIGKVIEHNLWNDKNGLEIYMIADIPYEEYLKGSQP